MDKQYKSVLSISHFVFDELSFKRKGFQQPNQSDTPFEVGHSVKKTGDNNYIVSLMLKVNKENEYDAVVRMSGYCVVDDNDPMLDILLHENAPAILYPYARAQMTMLTSQPETTPLVLPVVNIHALFHKDSKEAASNLQESIDN